MTINERFKRVRKALGLTQAVYGEKIGLKQSAVGQIEQSLRNITDRTVMLLCKSFHVNETWLRDGGNDDDMFSDFGETGIAAFSSEYDLDSLSQTILATYVTMHSKKREGINLFLSEISKEIMKGEIEGAYSGIIEMISNISTFQPDKREGSMTKLENETNTIFSGLRSSSYFEGLSAEPSENDALTPLEKEIAKIDVEAEKELYGKQLEEMIQSKEKSSASSGQKKKQA